MILLLLKGTDLINFNAEKYIFKYALIYFFFNLKLCSTLEM